MSEDCNHLCVQGEVRWKIDTMRLRRTGLCIMYIEILQWRQNLSAHLRIRRHITRNKERCLERGEIFLHREGF